MQKNTKGQCTSDKSLKAYCTWATRNEQCTYGTRNGQCKLYDNTKADWSRLTMTMHTRAVETAMHTGQSTKSKLHNAWHTHGCLCFWKSLPCPWVVNFVAFVSRFLSLKGDQILSCISDGCGVLFCQVKKDFSWRQITYSDWAKLAPDRFCNSSNWCRQGALLLEMASIESSDRSDFNCKDTKPGTGKVKHKLVLVLCRSLLRLSLELSCNHNWFAEIGMATLFSSTWMWQVKI